MLSVIAKHRHSRLSRQSLPATSGLPGGNSHRQVLIALLALCLLPAATVAAATFANWQQEIISLVSHKQFREAGEKLREVCVDGGDGNVCLILASAHFDGEANFGIESRQIIEAYQYTKMACDRGSQAGCDAYVAAIEDGELIQYVLFEPGIKDRDTQLQKAIGLGADLNTTTLFSATLLQKAIDEENSEALGLLLKYGADVNYRVSDEDLTPLMYAVNSGSRAMVALLLEHGADPAQRMKVPDYLRMGKAEANACDFADKLANSEIRELLGCQGAGNTAR
jgi:hypothetical protein